MTKWKHLVDGFFLNSDPNAEFRHIANPPASTAEVSETERKIGISLPAELRSFYCAYNGIGLSHGDEPDTPRFIRPVNELPEFITSGRSWFAETHPNVALRFVPFLDWENGDVMGYLFNEDGSLNPFLVTFLHEEYNGTPSQDPDEFLGRGPASLVELFTR